VKTANVPIPQTGCTFCRYRLPLFRFCPVCNGFWESRRQISYDLPPGDVFWRFRNMHGKLHGLSKIVLKFSVNLAYCQIFGIVRKFYPSCLRIPPGSPVGGNEKTQSSMHLLCGGTSWLWLVAVSVLTLPKGRWHCALILRTLQWNEVRRYLG